MCKILNSKSVVKYSIAVNAMMRVKKETKTFHVYYVN